IGCSRPLGPTRYGPRRCCSSAATLRSTYTMMAAEFSSITKTKSVRTIWAISSGVIHPSPQNHESTKQPPASMRSYRMLRAPRRWQRATAFLDVRFVLVPEMLQCREHRGHGGITEGAQRLARDIVRHARQEIEIAHLTLTALDALEDLV